MPGPLDGIRVLELTQIIAGPMCGVMLSDLGADVVKIESPQGDGTRVIGQFAPNESKGFHVFNRGKRGIVLNLQSEDGRAVVYRLIRDFDVFLINARPGVAERLGIDYETLSTHNRRLIYLENTAFGPEGPSADRAGADIIAQAYSGLMVGDGKMDDQGNPTLITATTPADFGAAFNGATAVCAALFHRERTGRGQLIETSLLGAALTLQNYIASRQPVSDSMLVQPSRDAMQEVRERGGSYRELLEARSGLRAITGAAYLLYYGGYQTADGAIMLGCVTPPNRQQVRRALGLTEADDATDAPGFNPLSPDSAAIVHHAQRNIAERFRSNTTAHWMARLDAAGAPASQVNTPEDILDDPQVQAIGAPLDLEHPLTGPETMIGPTIRMSDSPLEAQGPSPGFDGDTDQVLREHGYRDEEITALRASGAIGIEEER
ncbi:MAG: CoA transferase [Chloroflexota bacterium]|nr:CoA transferase [Chloroflexota bacterium]